ncbi:hypothetical protein BKA64DRAFT_159242 [Cadophora sp. MPI-SDFR-AT-0126]|nr:hypothetical protein BKA64DRAFT_159242 [Leotiomycetes sp. MPI-SDFR-AT-0126]
MQDLPPTIRTKRSKCCSRKDKRRPNGSGGRVTYTLRIGLWIGEQITTTHAEEIVLKPSNSLSPPICVQDFPRDYKIAQAKISRNLCTRTWKVLELSVVEPEPLEYNPKTDTLHTKLHFSITYEAFPSPKSLGLAIERCDVKLSLKAKTVISLNPLQAQPTAPQIIYSPYLSEIVQEHTGKIRTLNLPTWKEMRWEDTRDNKGHIICQYVLNFSMDFWQKRCFCLTPTFSSPMMLRRYSLGAVVTLHGANVQKFRLEIPVQICARSESSERDAPAYESEEVTERELVCIFIRIWRTFLSYVCRAMKATSFQHIYLDSDSSGLGWMIQHCFCSGYKLSLFAQRFR